MLLLYSVCLDVVVLESLELVRDETGFVTQEFDLLLVGFEDVQRVFDFLEFFVHVTLGIINDTTESGEGA